jgi:hypothetical protein
MKAGVCDARTATREGPYSIESFIDLKRVDLRGKLLS